MKQPKRRRENPYNIASTGNYGTWTWTTSESSDEPEREEMERTYDVEGLLARARTMLTEAQDAEAQRKQEQLTLLGELHQDLADRDEPFAIVKDALHDKIDEMASRGEWNAAPQTRRVENLKRVIENLELVADEAITLTDSLKVHLNLHMPSF